ARSASALNHPNVCTVYEVGEERHCPFIAMEYVEGRTLDAVIRDKPFSLPLALDYIFQIADALGHAHELGVVHGDLKTANILVSLAQQPDQNRRFRSCSPADRNSVGCHICYNGGCSWNSICDGA